MRELKKIKKNLQRLVVGVMCFCLLMTEFYPAFVAEAADKVSAQNIERYNDKNTTNDIIVVNPLYQDSITEEQANKLHAKRHHTSGQQNVIASDEEEYLTLAEAGRELCHYMKERANSFSISFMITDEELLSYGNIWTLLSESAFEHTGNPTEGDYLRWSWVSVSYGYSLQTDGTTHWITTDLDIEYMMTSEEEAEVDVAVDALLSELALDGMSDYEKAYTIYDYICQTVVYDHDNAELEGDEVTEGYKHAHCIYGALMNGKAVCQGYASMLYRLLLECGIDNRLVAGGNHGWNIICMDGVYYNGDTTWDAGSDTYYYFLTGSAYFRDDDSHMGYEDYVTPEFVNQYPVSPIDYFDVQDGTVMTGTGSCGDNLAWELDSTGTLTISGTGSMADLDSEFDSLWDYLNGWIKNVVIEEGVTSIGDYAFFNCSAMETVSLPSTLKSIGYYAFSLCDRLEEVVIPDSVTNIAEGTFYANPNLKKVVISNQLKSIPDSMFDTCQGLTTVDIPDSVKSIGTYAFYFCDSLNGLVLPDGLESIEQMAFYGAIALSGEQCLVIPDSVCEIGTYCFTLSGLTEVVWPAFATRMEEGTFYRSYRLKKVSLPETVEYIGMGVFHSCNHLESIVILENVSEMDEYVFSGCSNLEEIRFTGHAPSFKDTTFENVSTTVYYPANDDTWTEEIRTTYGSHLTWESYENGCDEHVYDENQPTWTWNETYSEATATFTCAICGQVDIVECEVTSEETEDGTIYTATCEYNGHTYKNTVGGFELPFTDVSKDLWYYESIKYVYVHGMMTGRDETTFSPDRNLTRAEFSKILYRIAGEPEVEYKDIFPDVREGLWYTDGILWAYEEGIVTGHGDGTFRPEDNITREQMALMMYRYAISKDYDVKERADYSDYVDADKVSSYAEEAMSWAVGNGIITGKDKEEGKLLDPQGKATRAECATIIMRFCEKYDE